MRGSPATAAILETLNATRATAKERHAEMERKIRQVKAMQLFLVTCELWHKKWAHCLSCAKHLPST